MSEGFNPVFESYQTLAINVNASTNSDIFDVAGFKQLTYQVVADTGTFSTAVFTAQCSVDGVNFVDIPSSSTTGGPGIKGELSVGSEYFRVRVSTLEGSAGTADLFVNAKR